MSETKSADRFEIVDVHTHLGSMPNVNYTRGLAELEAASPEPDPPALDLARRTLKTRLSSQPILEATW